MKRPQRGDGRDHRFRIIGGQWRGRRFSFPGTDQLRPSPDRVRETLFNWLAGVIQGASCLDLFAGSGALGLEALSRGAGKVVFVDRTAPAIEAIGEHLKLLGETRAELVCADAQSYLAAPGVRRFDIAFLDPPFGQGLLAPLCGALARSGVLAPGARVYLECEALLGEPELPLGWTLLRTRKAGRVGYHLSQSA